MAFAMKDVKRSMFSDTPNADSSRLFGTSDGESVMLYPISDARLDYLAAKRLEKSCVQIGDGGSADSRPHMVCPIPDQNIYDLVMGILRDAFSQRRRDKVLVGDTFCYKSSVIYWPRSYEENPYDDFSTYLSWFARIYGLRVVEIGNIDCSRDIDMLKFVITFKRVA